MKEAQVNNRIGIDAILFAIYIAITPIHQTLVLSNGATVTKYVAFAVMIAIIFLEIIREKKISFDSSLINVLGFITIWLVLGIVYSQSRSQTISSLISIISYFALMIIVCSKKWTSHEKHIFKIVLIAACVFYGVTLIQGVTTMRRATFISGSSGIKADHNILAINIGLGFLCSIYYFMESRRIIIRILMIVAALIMFSGAVCTGSRGALIAIIVSTMFFLLSNKDLGKSIKFRIVFFALVMIAAIIVFLNTDILGNKEVIQRFTGGVEGTEGFSGRIPIWSKYFEVLLHFPYGILVGYGYGDVSSIYKLYFGSNYPPATHNDILQLICCGGLIAVFLFYRFIRLVWKKASIEKNILGKACLMLVLIGGLTVDSFQRYGWWNAMIFAYIGIGALVNDEK